MLLSLRFSRYSMLRCEVHMDYREAAEESGKCDDYGHQPLSLNVNNGARS